MHREVNRRDFLTGMVVTSLPLVSGCTDGSDDPTSVGHSTTSRNLTTERSSPSKEETTQNENGSDGNTTKNDNVPPLSDLLIEIRAISADELSDDQLQWLHLMRPTELPPEQGEILQVAIEEGTVSKESPWSERWDEFVKTVIETRDSQIEDYRNEHSTHEHPTYLNGVHAEYQSNYYCIEVRREDEYASTCFV